MLSFHLVAGHLRLMNTPALYLIASFLAQTLTTDQLKWEQTWAVVSVIECDRISIGRFNRCGPQVDGRHNGALHFHRVRSVEYSHPLAYSVDPKSTSPLTTGQAKTILSIGPFLPAVPFFADEQRSSKRQPIPSKCCHLFTFLKVSNDRTAILFQTKGWRWCR